MNGQSSDGMLSTTRPVQYSFILHQGKEFTYKHNHILTPAHPTTSHPIPSTQLNSTHHQSPPPPLSPSPVISPSPAPRTRLYARPFTTSPKQQVRPQSPPHPPHPRHSPPSPLPLHRPLHNGCNDKEHHQEGAHQSASKTHPSNVP